ncbi:MAG TPA: hypothetical protein VGB46_02005 [Flavisolibacter sp.]|jgi:hypothetical protein
MENPARKRKYLTIVLWTGLLVGVLDLLAALTSYYLNSGRNPMNVIRYIASAVFGPKAFAGDPSMLFWGFLFHFLIAMCFTLFFFWLYPRLRLHSLPRLLTALMYGLLIWAVMNLLVLPQTQAPRAPFEWTNAITNMLILIAMIGLPLSFVAYRVYGVNRQSAIVNREW